MKKKLLIASLLGVSLFTFVGCGNADAAAPKETNSKQTSATEKEAPKDKEETSISVEDFNKKIRAEAVKGDFVKINDDEMDGKAVYVTGKISNSDLDATIPRFTLTTDEGDGHGIYSVVLFDDTAMDKIKNGESITMYGYVMPRNSSGLPELSANLVEA